MSSTATATTTATVLQRSAGKCQQPCINVRAETVGFQTSFVLVQVAATAILLDAAALPVKQHGTVYLKFNEPPNLSTIDVVLLSSFDALLGLPLLLRNQQFRGRVFATVPTHTLGRIHLEHLLQVAEYERSLPLCDKAPNLKSSGGQHNLGVRSLYRSNAIHECMTKVEAVSYGQRVVVDDKIVLCARPSGDYSGGTLWELDIVAQAGLLPPHHLVHVPTSKSDVIQRGSMQMQTADSFSQASVKLVIGNRVAAVTNRYCKPLHVPSFRQPHDVVILSNHSATGAGTDNCGCGLARSPQTTGKDQTKSTAYATVFQSLCADVYRQLQLGHLVLLPVKSTGGFVHELLFHLRKLEFACSESESQTTSVQGTMTNRTNLLARCRLVFVGTALNAAVHSVDTMSEWTTTARSAPINHLPPYSTLLSSPHHTMLRCLTGCPCHRRCRPTEVLGICFAQSQQPVAQ